MKSIKYFLLLFCLVFVSCGKSETEINGEAFVVTQGAGNYKLGLVQVSVIPENQIQNHINSKKSNAEAEAKTKYDEAKRRAKDAFESYERAKEKYNQQKAEVDSLQNSGDLELLRKGLKILDEMKWSASAADDAKANYDNLSAQAADAFKNLLIAASAENYFSDLPNGIVSAQTNADGKFTLVIPQKGKYAIIAQSERKVSDKTEKYYWMVWVNADGKPINLMLSNNNTTDSGSPDSVVKTNNYDL